MTRIDRILAASGGDPEQAALVARMLERRAFVCENCRLDFEEPFCDFCGASLMPTHTTDAASTTVAGSARGVRPTGG